MTDYLTHNARALGESPFAEFLVSAFHEDVIAPTIAREEAEASRLIGAKPCPNAHGVEIPAHLIRSLSREDDPFLPIPGPCLACGAVL